jgi:hypothetical protein
VNDPWYTVGWWDRERHDWYFNGEYQGLAAARACAQKTANLKNARSRVTDQFSGDTEYFEPEES